jgi:hypothetical protein
LSLLIPKCNHRSTRVARRNVASKKSHCAQDHSHRLSTGLHSFRYSISQIRATTARFYMTTQTPLSADRRTRRREKLPTPSHGHAASHSSSLQPQASSFQNLIANLELEFRPTHRKISPLKISNRKYLALFHLASQARRRAASPNFQNGNLLSFPFPQLRSRKPLTPHKASSLRLSLATGHSSLITRFLIYGAAIRNRRNSLKT